MSKYWRNENPITPEEINAMVWEKWHPADTAPHDTIIMGREWGTNKAFAVRWDDSCGGFVRPNTKPVVKISQWISFTDFADMRTCVWRNMP